MAVEEQAQPSAAPVHADSPSGAGAVGAAPAVDLEGLARQVGSLCASLAKIEAEMLGREER
eukprot:9196852-Alexandrium_andersonii.AAC.1